MMLKLNITIILVLLFFCSDAQDINYARQIISTLCSPAMHGRGYVNNGDIKAAKYIKKEIQKNGIKDFRNNYFQPFPISINTFPSKMDVAIDNRLIVPGKDFLLSSFSSSIKGEFQIMMPDSYLVSHPEFISKLNINPYKDKFVIIDTTGLHIKNFHEFKSLLLNENPFQAKGYIEPVTKLSAWYPSSHIQEMYWFEMLNSLSISESKTIRLDLKNKFYDTYLTNNIVGFIEGEVDSFIVFTAHYDHLGRLGKDVYFPGAHDNASGTALVLDLARHFSSSGSKPHYSIAFIFFSAEELGLLGSKYYTENPFFPLSKIKFLFNLDLIGSGEDGIKVVNGSVFGEEFNQLVSINESGKYLKAIESRGTAQNSDHYYFYENGVRCFFIYTLGQYKEYHNINDKAEGLPLNAYNQLFQVLIKFSDKK
jgi:hypothetical protein